MTPRTLGSKTCLWMLRHRPRLRERTLMTKPMRHENLGVVGRLDATNRRLDHLIAEIEALTEATRMIDARLDYVTDVIKGTQVEAAR